MRNGNAVLSVDGADLAVGGRILLRGLELRVEAGQCWCVLGPNGSGKSSLLRALAGFDAAWHARLHVDARPLSTLPAGELARLRAWMGQERSHAFGLGVLQSVLLARHPHALGAWESADDVRICEAALRRLDVAHLADRDIRTLSGGEAQRVALAAAWAQDTPLLLLDEPANHLDLAHQMLLPGLLRTAREQGRAAVVVLHDLNLVERCATHVLLLMPDGRWRSGPVADIMQPALLQSCLSCALQTLEHEGGRLWLPLPTTTDPKGLTSDDGF